MSPSRRRSGAASPLHCSRDGAVSVSAFDRVIAAVDASHYLITPRAVVTPTGIDEVAALLDLRQRGG